MYSVLLREFIYVYSMDDSMVSQENFCPQNCNGHKCLPVTKRVDKTIHGPSFEALENSM